MHGCAKFADESELILVKSNLIGRVQYFAGVSVKEI